LQIPGGDLKGVLLKVRNELDNPNMIQSLRDAGIRPIQLQRTLDKLLANIEYQQVQSRLGDTLQLFLPVLWNKLKEEQITFKSGNRSSPETPFSCTINLAFEHIGKLRSHVLFQSGRIHVNFVSDNPIFTDMLKGHANHLGNQLERVGLPVGRLSVKFKSDLDFSEDVSDRLDIKA
ncbi:MAG TPA: flagellar hook-length control protein FliK, partial [Nitrospirota bacterium]|nr:flagellar hook-length control protein FliK [Nitrospirota bacterium]